MAVLWARKLSLPGSEGSPGLWEHTDFTRADASSVKGGGWAGLGLEENQSPLPRNRRRTRFSRVFKQRKASLLGLSLRAASTAKKGSETVTSTIVVIQQPRQLQVMFSFQQYQPSG